MFLHFLTYFSLVFSVSSTSSSYQLPVDSKLLWNPLKSTSFPIGSKLLFVSDPTDVWYDVNMKIQTTADGYPNVGVTMRYNVSNDNIMAMICCMNNVIKNCANVGSKGELLVTDAGYISCFANDNPNTYGNNNGTIVTTVTLE